MQVQHQPKPQLLISTFLLFFIIHDMQVSIGIHGFQRIIYQESKHDAWISVTLSGILTYILIYVIIKTLQIYGSSDIYGIQYDVFGNLLGKLMNALYILYCLVAFIVIMKNYIEVIQTWMYPQVPNWFLSISLLLLVIYGVTGGIRVMVGVSFFNIIFSLWLYGFVGFPLRYSELHQFWPVLESDLQSLLKGTYKMTLSMIGFEILYVIYPHLKEKDKAQRFAQMGNAASTILYLILMLVSIAYFGSGQLERTIWPTLSIFKIVKFPFVERTEYIAIAFWMIIIIPNLMYYLWAAVRGVNRSFQKKDSHFIWIFSFIILIVTLSFNSRQNINNFNDYFARFAFYYIFCYPIILFLFVLLKKKIRKSKEKQT
ncbi:GerAB/ArcD/ProY family transporter [Pseudoneobacillus sp. C159]